MAEVEDSSPHRSYLRFAYAAVIIAAAFLLRLAIVRLIGAELPAFITFYPAVMVAALLCGLGPGFLATALSALAADYWILPPRGSFAIANPAEAIALGLFAAMGIFISLVAEAYRRNQQRVAALKREVTLHETQQKLRQSEAQFATLANAIPQLCWMANADGWIFWYNQRWYDYTGTTPEQMEGWGWQSVHDPEALPNVMARWQGSIATGEPFDMVFPLRGADGVFRPFLTRVMQLKDADGKIARWFGTNTDIGEQKQAEIELRKSKERLDLAVEVAGLGEWELNLRNGTASHSLRHDQIFGYPSVLPEWSYEKFLEHVLPELRESVNRQINSGNSWSIETKIRRADGEVRWIWVRGRRRVNDAGQVERMFGVVTDITERKQAEEERARLAAIVESSGDAIISKDLSGIVSSWNQSAEQLFGYSAQEMIGQPITRVIPPERLHEETDFLARLRAGECIEHYETVRVDRQGRRIDVSVTLSPIYDSAGAVVGISKSVRDVTERKKAEEALRQQADMLRLSFDAIIVWRLDGGIESWNRGAERLYSYSEAEALGRVTHELLKTTHFVPWPAIEAELRERGHWEGELRHIAKDGREVMVSARHQLIVGSEGIVRILETNRDITERKQAEEAVRQSLERLEKVLDVQTVGVMFWDLNTGCMVDSNDAFLKLMGYSRSQVEARELNWQKLTPPEYMDVSRAEVTKFLATGRVGPYEKEYFCKDGTRRWLLFAGSSLGDNQCVEFCVDIADRKKAEAALRSSQAKLQAVIGSAMDAIISVDDEQRIVVFNRAAENIFQCPATEALGSSVSRFIPEQLRELHSEHIRRFGEQGITNRSMHLLGALTGVRSGGEEFPIEATISQVQADGQTLYTVILRDITERKQAEEALQASEHRWATTLRSIGDAVISTDPDGKIDFMNDVAQKLTGWTLDDARGRDLPDVFDIVQEVTRIRPESPVAKVIRMGKVVGLANHTALIHRNGSEIPIEDSAAPIRDDQGKMEGVVLVFHDCLEQRKVEAALRSSERLATTGRLAATIAHEIHNPLDAVGNLLFLIREEAKDDNMREYASMASGELARVTQMTQQMLGFQREAARPVPVKIGEILSNVIALYDRKIQTAGIRLEQRIDHDVRVVALPGELRQIFANLVGNAIEAVGPQRGTIALRAYSTQDRRRGVPGVCVVVADNGPGIPEQVRSKIFEPFFTTKGESGTGLGLWITADILRKYDGAMRLRTCTRPARSGTCFSVFLPFQINSESTPRS